MKFHHFGIARKDFESLKLFYRKQNYSIGEEVYDSIQNVNLIFCTSTIHLNVELIKPFNKKSPLNNF